MSDKLSATAEAARIASIDAKANHWRLWGPYLSERQWGTVREDYSADGDGWDYVTHDESRSQAYRWGEDGLAGLCDDRCRLCLSLALWNGQDAILKERLFGLTNSEGNHGEDVKECYYYLDATPSHSYLKMLYKYPQAAFPYVKLIDESRHRDRTKPEYELLDTGIFDDDRYFDVFVEYAKADTKDVLMRITIHNRGDQAAELHVLPQLWFRNTWTWCGSDAARPSLEAAGPAQVNAHHAQLGDYFFYLDGRPKLLFCENESNVSRLFNQPASGYFKDAFHQFVVDGDEAAINPARRGTKAAGYYTVEVPAGECREILRRLTSVANPKPFRDFEDIFARRLREADDYYAILESEVKDPAVLHVQRQAVAGMIWSKQFYYYDVHEWLKGDPTQPAPPSARLQGRNSDWQHLNNADVISMPDKWEYPWYAAWDLAFHCIPFAVFDPEFAKSQLVLLTREWYMHPNGQLPAYEWALGDVNPPVHAWATWRVFQIDRRMRGGDGDLAFLERVFHKLLLNFTWWVNRKDEHGKNIFQGGFLGLDNIGVFDRSKPLPGGGYINQADGTSWMAMYSLNLMRIALELSLHNPVYQDIATKFFEHFLHIAEAMTSMGETGVGLWDDVDGFYYDILNLPDGQMLPLKVRSMVGLIPLFAVETLEPELLERVPEFNKRLKWLLKNRPDLASLVSRWEEAGRGERRLLSLLRGSRMKKLLRRMLDESEFLSPYGVALSKFHQQQPYIFSCDHQTLSVAYQPAESDTWLFGGNSNWRGPVWFPVNFLIIESLQKFHHYYGDDFKIECPTGSGNMVTILEASEEITRRLARLFLPDAQGHRPFSAHPKMQNDPHFKDHILFYEYFHGDTGRGCGAEHQTGWTALIAKLLHPRRPGQ